MALLTNKTKWKMILIVDLLLGLLLCFGLLTGYAWNNEWVNLVFPPTVGFIGIMILMFKKKVIAFRKWVDIIAYLPSLLVGIPYLLSTIILISVSLFLMSNTFIEEKAGGIIIQQEFAPDGVKFVQVECFPAVAHNGNWIKIDVIYQAIPFAKRFLTQYWDHASCESMKDGNYVSWSDNGKVFLLKEQKEFQVDPIGWNNLLEFNWEN